MYYILVSVEESEREQVLLYAMTMTLPDDPETLTVPGNPAQRQFFPMLGQQHPRIG
jgi:hypothetical protein